MTTRDPLSPQWEDCKVCGGDHWTKDHPTPSGGVAVAEAVALRHHWVYDGTQTGGMLVYHCDDHDPPVVRQVWPGVTL
jgi:hypothetical protein